MKKLVMMIALCIGVSSFAMAQDVRHDKRAHMTPEQRAEKQSMKLKETLQLSDAQQKSVYDANLQAAKDMQTLRKEIKEANKDKFKVIQQNRDNKMKNILSAEQYTKYQALKAERKKKMMDKRGDDQKMIEQKQVK